MAKRALLVSALIGIAFANPALAQSSPTPSTGPAPAPALTQAPRPQVAAPPYGAPISLEQARIAANQAEAEARRNNWNVVIAIVDGGGHLVYLRRFDGTQTASIDIALGKAKTSAAFRRPTKLLEDGLQTSNRLLSVSDVTLLEGGLPIVIDGKIVGAIGVSGVASSQDAQIAAAGIAGLK